jgi:oxalate decarboxylase/phosphoglucose isomerase-like protein (cupin superfamily)
MTDHAPRPPVLHPDEVDAYGFPWGRLHLTVSPQLNGARNFSGGVVTLPAGEGHSRHNHPDAEEILFIFEGHGEQMVEDESGEPRIHPVRPGSTILIPQARYHSTLNTGSGTMRFFVVYSPAGPERLLRDLPGFQLIPPAPAAPA